jgi:hypothetical protein
MKLKLDFKMDKDRFSKMVPLNEYIAITKYDDPEAIKNVMARFMLDPETKDYYPVKITDTEDEYKVEAAPEALAKMGMLTMERLRELVSVFLTGAQDAAVPPTNG